MGQVAENIGQIWHGFTPTQRRNIAIYIVGIMCYKFALEYYNGSFITQANERFGDRRFTAIGLLTGLNYAAQAIGSIIVAPLAKRFPTRSILACAVFAFGLISAIPLIADAATGGQMKQNTANGKDKYGSWDPNGLYPIYVVSGLAYGCVEIIRRIIPRDLVGGDPHRLKRMDALVHILYEVAGTTGAFTSASLIGKFGYNYSAFLSPILFSLAGVLWFFISSLGESRAAELAMAREKAAKEGRLEEYDAAYEASRDKRTVFQKLTCRGRSKQPVGLAGVELRERGSVLSEMGGAVRSFGKAFWYGGYLVLTNRKFIWLLPAYTLALYGHRYLENGLGPIWAKSVAGTSSFSQILTGGSNLGELCGALSVLLFTNAVKTPLPWLRLDAIALNLVWVLPFFPVERNQVVWAWRLAAVFLPISFGWAAGDVSLSAHIQATLARMSNLDGDVSPLGAIMAFLYTMYIIIYAVLSAVLGRVVDNRLSGLTGAAAVTAAQDTLKYVGGVHFTILSVIIFAATFIPRGAVALNPNMIDEADFENDRDTESAGGEDFSKAYGKESHSEDEVSEKGLHFDPQSNNLENSAAGIVAQNPAAVAAMPTK